MKELINKVAVRELDVEQKIDWLSQDPNNGHELAGLNILVRYLLRQNEILKARIDLLVQEKFEK